MQPTPKTASSGRPALHASCDPWRRCWRLHAVVSRAVPCNGLRSVDVAREPARHRSLPANASKLYAMGFRSAVRRSTLADANKSRHWRIWSDLVAVLIRRARMLYLGATLLGVELDTRSTAGFQYCQSMPEPVLLGAALSTKAVIKLHTVLDLRAAIPACRAQEPYSEVRICRSRCSRRQASPQTMPPGEILNAPTRCGLQFAGEDGVHVREIQGRPAGKYFARMAFIAVCAA